jgi:hypothetical protein
MSAEGGEAIPARPLPTSKVSLLLRNSSAINDTAATRFELTPLNLYEDQFTIR